MTTSSKLFQPYTIGDLEILHRVVLAPLTRSRSSDSHVPGPLVAEYYAQRASRPGTLLISEGVLPDVKAGGWPFAPGIWSDEQIIAWKKVTDAVHAKGSYIFCQLWVLGRAANPTLLEKDGVVDGFIAPSPIRITISKHERTPRELTLAEIQEYPGIYATAALNAMKAGFDGVELHNANGYLMDSFLQDMSNKRTDEYGGSIEKRTKFARSIADAVVGAVGAKKVGIRFSPWGRFQDMGMVDPVPTFSHLVSSILSSYPEFAYFHVVEPGVDGSKTREDPGSIRTQSNDFIRDIVREKGQGTKVISCGAFTRERAIEMADSKGDLVAFGRLYLANPDLPLRLEKNLPLNEGVKETYYVWGSFTPLGYTDYPFITADTSATVAA